jgi:hypothetical protein
VRTKMLSFVNIPALVVAAVFNVKLKGTNAF